MKEMETYSIVFNKRYTEYLTSIKYLPEDLRQIINDLDIDQFGGTVLKSQIEIVEQFHDVFSDRLASNGFDQDYNPNMEGQILEELIDQFGATLTK